MQPYTKGQAKTIFFKQFLSVKSLAKLSKRKNAISFNTA